MTPPGPWTNVLVFMVIEPLYWSTYKESSFNCAKKNDKEYVCIQKRYLLKDISFERQASPTIATSDGYRSMDWKVCAELECFFGVGERGGEWGPYQYS